MAEELSSEEQRLTEALRSKHTSKTPKRSLLSLVADLGPAPSAEEIDEARREMWAGFAQDDS